MQQISLLDLRDTFAVTSIGEADIAAISVLFGMILNDLEVRHRLLPMPFMLYTSHRDQSLMVAVMFLIRDRLESIVVIRKGNVRQEATLHGSLMVTVKFLIRDRLDTHNILLRNAQSAKTSVRNCLTLRCIA